MPSVAMISPKKQIRTNLSVFYNSVGAVFHAELNQLRGWMDNSVGGKACFSQCSLGKLRQVVLFLSSEQRFLPSNPHVSRTDRVFCLL